MLHLLRRDSVYIWLYLIVILLLPVLLHLFRLPELPLSTYIVLLYVLLSAPFYYEKIKHVDRFMISLPIKKSKLVLARYISLIAAVIVGTFYMLGFEALFHDESATSSPIILLFTFTLVFAVIATALPVYYLFEKLWAAVVGQFLVVFTATAVLYVVAFTSMLDIPVDYFFRIIDWNPLVVLLLFSFVLLSLSYGLSCFIYVKKDH